MSGRATHDDGWIGDRGSGSHRLPPVDSESETAPLLKRRRNGVDDKRRWRSIRVMYVTMFIGSIGFSIILSSVWPFLQSVDMCVSAAFLGYVVAAYSIGQLIASPFFGWWANRRKSSLMPIVVSLVINFLGCMMYGFSGALPGDDQTNGVFMLMSRFIIGLGAGSVSVVRAYVSSATTLEERTAAMANISAGQSLGFIIGPGLAAAFRPIGETGVTWKAIKLQVNMYTLPSFLGAVLALINIAVLMKWFTECTIAYEGSIQTATNRSIQDEPDESHADDDDADDDSRTVNGSSGDGVPLLCACCESGTHDKPESQKKGNGVDYVAALICIWLFFVVLFIFSVFETILSPLSMDEFGWNGEEATLYNGILLLASGTVAVATFLTVKVLAKKFDERNIFVGGMVICAMAFILYIPFSPGQPPLNYFNGTVTHRGLVSDTMDEPPDFSEDFLSPSRSIAWTGVRASDMLPYYGSESSIRYNKNEDGDTFDASNVGVGASLQMCENANFTNFTAEGACPVSKYSWCTENHHLNFVQFLGGSLLMAVGYPTCGIMSYTIFSKILGPFPQGTMMGWLTAAGSAARAFGPMIVSNIYSASGPRVAFASTSGFVFLTIGVLLTAYRRLVPYKAGRRR